VCTLQALAPHHVLLEEHVEVLVGALDVSLVFLPHPIVSNYRTLARLSEKQCTPCLQSHSLEAILLFGLPCTAWWTAFASTLQTTAPSAGKSGCCGMKEGVAGQGGE
jgi:hypothetical protein